MTRTTNVKKQSDELEKLLNADHKDPTKIKKAGQDLGWRLENKQQFKDILKAREEAWQETSIPFLKEVWPVLEAFAIYLARSSRQEYYRLKDYFKDDWREAEGFLAKSLKICKYGVLLGLGVASCHPLYASIIGLTASLWTAVVAVNSGNGRDSDGRQKAANNAESKDHQESTKSKDFRVTKNIAGLVFGVIIGSTLGAIPVIGPGMAVGLINGSITSIKEVAKHKLPNLGLHNFGYLGGQVIATSLLGLIRGAAPVVGMATATIKTERYKTKQKTPQVRDTEKEQEYEKAKAVKARADEFSAQHKQEALKVGKALQKQGVVHDDSPSLVSRVVSGVKSLFTGSGTADRGL